MYEGDAPLAERRAAALALDRDLLRDLLGAEELRELLDPEVLADVELELQCIADGRRARSADELHDVFRKVGDLTADEVELRSEPGGRGWLDGLLAERRVIEIALGGETRYAAAEDAARYRDAFGCSLPLGLPMAFTDPVPRPLEEIVGRYARTHGPFLTADVAKRFGAPPERIAGALAALEGDERLVVGEFRPEGVSREFCDVDVLRQLRRRSLAALRKEVEPVEQEAFARFLAAWHGIPAGRRGMDALVETLGVLSGTALVASTIETDVLPARVAGFRPSMLDELCTAGEVIWIGAGALGARDGRVRLCFADQLPLLAPGWEEREPAEGALQDAIRTLLGEQGASFWGQIRGAAPGAQDQELLAALWDLVWAGEVTNDSLAPLRSVLGGAKVKAAATGRVAYGRSRPRPGRLTRIGPPAGQGRWSLVEPLLRAGADADRGGARAGDAARRAPRRRHPRGGDGRGARRRIQRRVRRAQGVGGAWAGAPRLLRRRSRRRAVRGTRCRRSVALRSRDARPAHPTRRRARSRRARVDRPGAAVRCRARLARHVRSARPERVVARRAPRRATARVVRPARSPPRARFPRPSSTRRGPRRSSRS